MRGIFEIYNIFKFIKSAEIGRISSGKGRLVVCNDRYTSAIIDYVKEIHYVRISSVHSSIKDKLRS